MMEIEELISSSVQEARSGPNHEDKIVRRDEQKGKGIVMSVSRSFSSCSV